jgi:hypothetical protein
MEKGGVKNYQNLPDVIYGRPLNLDVYKAKARFLELRSVLSQQWKKILIFTRINSTSKDKIVWRAIDSDNTLSIRREYLVIVNIGSTRSNAPYVLDI